MSRADAGQNRARAASRRLRLAVYRFRRALRHSGLARPALTRAGSLRVLRLGTKGGIVLVVAGVLLFVTVMAVSAIYFQYGSHPARTAQTWAALAPRFAGAGTCGTCHAPQSLRWATEDHQRVPCESCHGPMAGHELPGSATPDKMTDPASKALCASCHRKVQGRPVAVAQVDLATHFEPGTCVGCHDPHSTIALVPPRIPHPLDKLPDCKTCHGPGGLRAVPATHPIFPNDQCRGCHELLVPAP